MFSSSTFFLAFWILCVGIQFPQDFHVCALFASLQDVQGSSNCDSELAVVHIDCFIFTCFQHIVLRPSRCVSPVHLGLVRVLLQLSNVRLSAHFLKNLVDEATAGEARPSVDQCTLMVQRVGSEQLCFASSVHSCCPER